MKQQMKLKSILKLSLVSLLLVPSFSSAQNYRNGVAEVAQAYDALFRNAGWGGVEASNAVARSECGEIFSANARGYSCAACDEQAKSQCAPVKAYDVGIIGEESRDYLNEAEYEKIGKSVGTLECQNARGQVKSTTAYVVAPGVLKATAHANYVDVLDANGNPTGKQTKVFDLKRNCLFALRDIDSLNVVRYKVADFEECAADLKNKDLANCDWAVIKLADALPRDVKPLKMLVARGGDLSGAAVVAVGHHHGVKLEGKEVPVKAKLIDYGFILPKTQKSYIKGYEHLIQYTVDTNGVASGQPIAIQTNGELYVVASHRGEIRRPSVEKGKADDSSHINFGELNNSKMIDVIKEFSPQGYKSQFETETVVPRAARQIEI
jgi:hypothetical protein